MKCISSEDIQWYIDGELTKEEDLKISHHVNVCSKCADQYNRQKRLADFVRNGINEPENSLQVIPEFKHPDKKEKQKRLSTRQKLIYSLSAASILLLIGLSITQNNKSQNQDEYIILQNIDDYYDANQPITDQTIVYNVIDPDGNVSELNIE